MFARAAAGLPGAYVESGAVDRAMVELLEEAIEALGGADDALRARALARLAAELYFADAPARRIALSQEAIALARRAGDPETLGYVLEAAHLALWGPDNVAERLAITAELLRLAERVGDPNLEVLAHAWRVTAVLELGDSDAADAALDAHARLARAYRQPLHLWTVAMWAAMRALLDGRFADAERHSGEMLTILRMVGDPDAEMFVGLQTFVVRREQGRLAELEPALRTFAEQFPTVPLVRTCLAYLYAELGRAAEARAEFERLAADDFAGLPRDLTWLASLAVLADVCAFLGDAERAATLYALLLPYAGRITMFGHGLVCCGAVGRPLGRLAATLGCHQEATRHSEAALAQHSKMGARPLLAHTQHEYAELLLGIGRSADRARALELLDRALESARELGMTRLAQQVAALRDSLGRRPTAAADMAAGRSRPPPVVDSAGVLTRREREVAALLARGLSNRQIAAELVISERTAEMHVGNLLTKLGLASRAQVAVWAAERGLAAAPPR